MGSSSPTLLPTPEPSVASQSETQGRASLLADKNELARKYKAVL